VGKELIAIPTIVDFASQETQPNTKSLPLALATGAEIPLTSIFLYTASASNKIILEASVGWQPEIILLPLVPKLTFRIRRGGATPAFPEVYQTSDSAFFGAGTSEAKHMTTTMIHVEAPPAMTVGTYQPYYLTVMNNGPGHITVTGPVTLIGTTIGL
jgi:hypothetical protein